MSNSQFDGLRREAEAFLSETNREYYENFGGLKEEFNLSDIYKRHSDLFRLKTVEMAKQAAASRGDQETTRQARYFFQFVLDGFLGETVKDLDEEITRAEARETISFKGEDVPYRKVPVLIANNPDRAERDLLSQAKASATERLNAKRQERFNRVHEIAKVLGFQDYVELYGASKGIDLDGLGQMMRAFFGETEALYHDALTAAFQKTFGRDLAGAERHDLAFLLRADRFDAAFAGDKMVPALKSTLKAMGVDLQQQENIIVDVETRPSKSPRAFCAPVRLPQEIYLVMLPKGGQDDYMALFHEAGHAEHFAHVSPSDPMEYRWLGDNSVTEAFAFCLEHLVAEPVWLARHTGLEDTSEILRFFYLQKLYFVRRYAAKLLYELELHRTDDVSQARETYATWLSRATLVRVPGVDYLADVDDGFYAANYLRAWILEAQLKEHLRRRFGPTWFDTREAGEFLVSLWRQGQKYDADEIARTLGYDGLSIQPLTREIFQGLGVAAVSV